jgi:hypothetical protein
VVWSRDAEFTERSRGGSQRSCRECPMEGNIGRRLIRRIFSGRMSGGMADAMGFWGTWSLLGGGAVCS